MRRQLGLFTVREWMALALACTGLTVLVFLTETSILESFDFLRFHEPLKTYGLRALRSGRLPLWNPHVGLGRPFLADIETGCFYPATLLYAALGLGIGVVLSTALHLLLAVAGTAFLARHLGASKPMATAAGLAFVASGPVVLSFYSGQINYSFALCWLPTILWLALRLQDPPVGATAWPAVGWLASALALQTFAGHPQAVWVTAVATATLLLARRLERPWLANARAAVLDQVRFGAALALAALVCAVQLLPFAALVSQRNRQTPSLAFANHFSMPLAAWSSLLVQVLPGHPIISVYYAYAGVVAFLAGAAGLSGLHSRNVRALLATALIGFLVATGTETPVFALLYRLLPGMSALRLHARMNVLVILAFIAAAALHLSESPHRRRGKVAVAAAAAAAAALTLHASRVVQLLAVVAASALLILWPAVGRRRLALALAVALVALAALDAAVSVRAMQRAWALPPSTASVEPDLAEALGRSGLLAPHLPPPRIQAAGTRENAGMLFGWSTYVSYGSLALERTWSYLHAAAGTAPPELDNTYPAKAVRQKHPFTFETMNVVAALDPVRGKLYRNPAPDPRVYLAGRAESVDGWRSALARMLAGHDVATVPLVESPTLVPPLAASAGGTVVIRDFQPERISIDVHSDGPALLVVKEAWYPGWSATVNGRHTPCEPANVWMRAVPVPAGRSQVVLQFRSTMLATGCVVSLFGVLLVVIAINSQAVGRFVARLRRAQDRSLG